jgi:hypothetical protein
LFLKVNIPIGVSEDKKAAIDSIKDANRERKNEEERST